jgi:excisionase family DNA binding protein
MLAMTAPVPGDQVGRFLTVAETAEVLNISVSQAYALVRSGELPAIRIGAAGHWRVERVELEAFIAAGYEEARRRAHWNESEFQLLSELRGDRLL